MADYGLIFYNISKLEMVIVETLVLFGKLTYMEDNQKEEKYGKGTQ